MRILLIIVCVVVFIWATKIKKKIDEEEEIGLKTPEVATKLRENYGEILNMLLQNPNHTLVFERKYDESVRLSNHKNQELFMRCSGLGSHGAELHVACYQDSMVLKVWTFDKRRTNMSIYQEIVEYFK